MKGCVFFLILLFGGVALVPARTEAGGLDFLARFSICLPFEFLRKFRAADPSPSESRQSADIDLAFDAIDKDFHRNPRLIVDTKTRSGLGGEFYASNEFDWFKERSDRRSADVVIGFNTNALWDDAVRANAKEMVIGDWKTGPLQGQEYYFKPLILSARSAPDFLGRIAGIPVPESLDNRPIERTFEYIDAALKKLDRNRGYSRRVSSSMREMLGAVARHPKVSEAQLSVLNRYYQEVERRRAPGFKPDLDYDSHRFGPFRGYHVARLVNWYGYFKSRYDPRELIKRGANAKEVSDPTFSFVSSREAFGRLQRLFDGHLHFVHASIGDNTVYQTIRDRPEFRGYRDFQVRTSNIFEVDEADPARAQGRMMRFLRDTSRILGSSEHPVRVLVTRGVGRDSAKGRPVEHQYEVFDVASARDVEPVVERAGYNPKADPDWQTSDFDRIESALKNSRLSVVQSDRSRIRAYLDGIQVFVTDHALTLNLVDAEKRVKAPLVIDSAADRNRIGREIFDRLYHRSGSGREALELLKRLEANGGIGRSDPRSD